MMGLMIHPSAMHQTTPTKADSCKKGTSTKRVNIDHGDWGPHSSIPLVRYSCPLSYTQGLHTNSSHILGLVVLGLHGGEQQHLGVVDTGRQ